MEGRKEVYAPISNESLTIDERAIYVFSCLAPDCESQLWRGLRVQKISSHEVAHLPESSVSASNNDWQKDLWSFNVSEEEEHETDDDLDLEELSRAFSEATNLASSGKRQNNGSEQKKRLPANQQARIVDDNIPVMPCFYIYTQEEKQSKKVTSERSKHTLLSVKECEDNSEDNSNGEVYAEENYEYDRALNADRTYLKFKKRVDSYPEQCFRYSYSGKPLLASGEMGDPGICGLCGGVRHYEMQLMPPLIYFLHEAADDRQRKYLEKFNWMTLFIYTCSKSCADRSNQGKSGSEDWIVAEEAVIVQHE